MFILKRPIGDTYTFSKRILLAKIGWKTPKLEKGKGKSRIVDTIDGKSASFNEPSK